MGIHHNTFSAVQPGKPGSAMYPNSPLGEKVEGIPTGRDVDWEPLVDYRRNGVSGNNDSRCCSMGSRRRSHPFLRRKRPLLRPLNDETLHAQSLHRRVGGLLVGAESHRCGSHNGDTEPRRQPNPLLSESEWPLMLTPLDVPLIQFGRQGPPTATLVPHLLG